MPNKKITQLTINNTPTLLDVFPVVNDGITKQLSLTGLTAFIGPYIDTVNPIFTGGTVSGPTRFTNGLTANTISATTYQNLPIDIRVTGGTYSAGTTTFRNNTGGTFSVTGFTNNIKHWEQNQNKILKSDETIVISGDYVLVGTNLSLQKETEITIGSLTFNKYAQVYIGGNLLLLNSNIVNDGLINVAGAIIFSGNSTITGLGIIN
jgi:hypothetical protein